MLEFGVTFTSHEPSLYYARHYDINVTKHTTLKYYAETAETTPCA